MEAVSCEEAFDAGADATQERPRRSDAGPAKAQPRGSSRGPAQRAQTTRCKRGCGRPSAKGYDTCCRTCIQTDGQQHGPQCERRWEELAREAKTITHQERITQGWICEKCDFSNFLERPTCRKCETARPAITRSPEHLPGSRVDVLDAADAYDGWEQDLRSQHSVILKPSSASKKLSFECELCGVWLPSWSQVAEHCRGAQHQKKKKAALKPETEPETNFVPASSPICEEEWALMRLYAENGKLEDIDAKLRAGSDPNATGPADDRTPLFWAAWCGHARVITRLLEDSRAKERAMIACKGLEGIPPAPLCPMEVAHDKWGKASDVFAAFGHLHKACR